MKDPMGTLIAAARQVDERLRLAEANADRLANSLAIFVREHPDPGVEALGALHEHRMLGLMRGEK